MASLADLFLDLWHQLEQSPDLGDIVARIESDPFEDSIYRVEKGSLPFYADKYAKNDTAFWSWFDGGGDCLTEKRLMLAQAIDDAFRPLLGEADIHAHLSANLRRARANMRRHYAFNSDFAQGRVILRRPRWGRWEDPVLPAPDDRTALAELFDVLTVLPPELVASDPDDRDTPRPVRLDYRLVGGPGRLLSDDESLVVGFAPIAEAESDLGFVLHDEDSRRWYDANPDYALGERAALAVGALCAAGAQLIVFPEMMFTPDSLEKVRQAIVAHGPASRLHFVLAGTHRKANGHGRPHNEAVLFDHMGREVLRQAKLHRWNMDARACRSLGFDSEDSLHEYIAPGDSVSVVELPHFGRLLVMVCEDLDRSEPGAWLRSNMLLDWIVTPILDSSILPQRWMVQDAATAALAGKCRVVVANSLPLEHRRQRVLGAGGAGASGIGACVDWRPGSPPCGLMVMDDPGQMSPRHQVVAWDAEKWANQAKITR